MRADEANALLLAQLIRRAGAGILRVAIDGIDASGKTTLADCLASLLHTRGHLAVRSSIDRFHNPARTRHSRGQGSPEGYYLDSFNYHALVDNLLEPLSPGGTRLVRLGAFDYRTDQALHARS